MCSELVPVDHWLKGDMGFDHLSFSEIIWCLGS